MYVLFIWFVFFVRRGGYVWWDAPVVHGVVVVVAHVRRAVSANLVGKVLAANNVAPTPLFWGGVVCVAFMFGGFRDS